jgi:hypothetical protein
VCRVLCFFLYDLKPLTFFQQVFSRFTLSFSIFRISSLFIEHALGS